MQTDRWKHALINTESDLTNSFYSSAVKFIEAPRDSLMTLMDMLADKKIFYIHAPAGYGKTFSTHLWIKRQNAVYSWITIDERTGNAPADFYELLALALAELQPDNEILKELSSHQSFSVAPIEFTFRIIKAFKDDGHRHILVLDDLHMVSNKEILKMLPIIIHKLQDCLFLILLSRSAPNEVFSDLIIRGDAAIISSDNLIFSSNEIQMFFKKHGHSLTNDQANAIYSSTEGWALGINALLLSGVGAFNKKLVERHFKSFLKEQVWKKWDKKFQTFMIKTAVVTELIPELCIYLTGMEDSGIILEKLLWENAFLSLDKNGVYRFHLLFREFLLHLLETDGLKEKHKQLKKAGEWFYKQKEYYKSVEYFMQCKNYGGMTKGLKHMYDYNSPYAAIEDTLAIIHLSVDGSIVEKYPFLLEVQAWAAYVEGNAREMESYLDMYYKKFPQIVLQNPQSAQTMLLLRCMDYRSSLVEFTKHAANIPLFRNLLGKAGSPSITQNMPLFHRSSRDFSEYVFNSDENFLLLRKTVGVLFKNDYDIIEDCIRAGLLYEQGLLDKAQKYSLSANTRINTGFAPEIKFCAMMILANILVVQGYSADVKQIINSMSEMIEQDRAFYLNSNLSAYKYRLKLSNGDIKAAEEWLREYGETPYTELSFYKLFQHFTTARAFIVARNYNVAILFLRKLKKFCEDYNRILDIIETNILFAIAYWKKGTRYHPDALACIERAIIMAYPYGYTQAFANEGTEIVSMLQRTYKRLVQKDCLEGIPVTFVKRLHILALFQSKYIKGLSGGKIHKTLKFTDQQKVVMKLMCEGCGRKEIAEKMGLKQSGVKSHIDLIYKKLDVSNRMDAVMKINELNILN